MPPIIALRARLGATARGRDSFNGRPMTAGASNRRTSRRAAESALPYGIAEAEQAVVGAGPDLLAEEPDH